MDIASLYPQAQPPPNPLTTLSSIYGLRNQQNQNALFQQDFAAKRAIGQAYQQSIDPTTGELDTNKLLSAVAGDPRAAFLAGQVSQEALARKQTQLGVDTAAQALAVQRQNAANNVLGSVLSNVDGKGTFQGSKSDAFQAIREGYTSGMLDQGQTSRWLQDIHSLPDDPGALQGYLRQHVVQSLSPEQRAGMVFGTPQTIDTGSQKIIANVSPITGVQPLAALPTTLSPADLAAPQTWTDAAGVQHQGTRAQYLQTVGGGGLTPAATGPAAAPATAQGAQAAPLAPSGTGRYPAAASAPGGPVTGPAPGVVQAKELTGEESAKQGIGLQQIADQVPARKAALGGMLSDLEQFTSGPGADWTKFAKAAANRVAPFGIQFDAQGVSSQEGFAKLAKQIALAQTQSLGASTDEKLETALGANPNTDLSKLGNQQIIHILQGNEDAISAKNQAWQKYQQQNGPQSYGQFSTDFNKTFDPRLFQANYMTGPERTQLLQSLKGQDRKQFLNSLRNAVNNGWVKLGG